MKSFLVFALLTLFAAAPALASDSFTYTGKGTVTFNHKAHGEKLGCAACHEGEPTKIEISDKATGHAACLDCHKAKKAEGAPTSCGECHVK